MIGTKRLYTPEDIPEMTDMVDRYFEDCQTRKRRPIETGVALALGMTQGTWIKYKKEEGFHEFAEMVKTRIKAEWEYRLDTGQCTGAIVYLMNNCGYVDKRAVAHSGPDGGPIETKVTHNGSLAELRAECEKLARELGIGITNV